MIPESLCHFTTSDLACGEHECLFCNFSAIDRPGSFSGPLGIAFEFAVDTLHQTERTIDRVGSDFFDLFAEAFSQRVAECSQ